MSKSAVIHTLVFLELLKWYLFHSGSHVIVCFIVKNEPKNVYPGVSTVMQLNWREQNRPVWAPRVASSSFPPSWHWHPDPESFLYKRPPALTKKAVLRGEVCILYLYLRSASAFLMPCWWSQRLYGDGVQRCSPASGGLKDWLELSLRWMLLPSFAICGTCFKIQELKLESNVYFIFSAKNHIFLKLVAFLLM